MYFVSFRIMLSRSIKTLQWLCLWLCLMAIFMIVFKVTVLIQGSAVNNNVAILQEILEMRYTNVLLHLQYHKPRRHDCRNISLL